MGYNNTLKIHKNPMIKNILPGILILLLATSTCRAAAIHIGVTLGLSGQYAPMAKMQEQALRLWETDTNEHGGLLSRKVELTIYDDQSDKERARELYRQMIAKEHMDLLLPPYSSGLTAAIAPIAEKYGYPLLTSGASADSIWSQGSHYIFGIYSPASRYTLGFMEMLLVSGITKAAIISADDSFSKNVADGSEKWALRLGLEVVLHQTLKKESPQLDTVAQRIRNSGAQALIMCGHFDEAVNMRRALKHIQWYPRAYYASVGPVLQAYYDRLGADAESTFSSTQWMYYDKLPFPGSKAFHDSFVAAYGEEPSYHAAAAYAAGVVLASAVRQAGSLDRERIRDILAHLDIITLLGRYGVDRTGMQMRHFVLIIQWINGRKEVVWPRELSTAEPRFP